MLQLVLLVMQLIFTGGAVRGASVLGGKFLMSCTLFFVAQVS